MMDELEEAYAVYLQWLCSVSLQSLPKHSYSLIEFVLDLMTLSLSLSP